MSGIEIISEAMSSATVTSFYNIMLNEVQQKENAKTESLAQRIKQLEKEKEEIKQSTAKVIESLTMLNVQREGEFSHSLENLKDKIKEEEESHVKQKFSFAFNKQSKSKKYKKMIEELEDQLEKLKQKNSSLENVNQNLKK